MDRRGLIAGSGLAGLGLAAFAPSASAQSGGATTLDKILKEKVIRIASDTSPPPFGIIGADGKPDGVEVANCRQLAKDLGVELDLQQVVSTQRIPSLLAGRCDLTLSSISITFDRAKTVAFCNPNGALSIVVFGPKKTAIAKAEEMAGKRIGITRGPRWRRRRCRRWPRPAPASYGSTTSAPPSRPCSRARWTPSP